MSGSDDSSSADFAFQPPPSDPSAGAHFPPSSAPYKPDPIKTSSFSSSTGISPTNGPFTPSSTHTPHSYFPEGAFAASYTGQGISSASSFSSASGSAAGGSFSSVDMPGSSVEHLPAISREFARPTASETRRPATAGGALQSRSPFAGGYTMRHAQMGGEEGQRFTRLSDRPTSSDGKVRVGETIEEGAEMFANPFGSGAAGASVSPQSDDELRQVPSQSMSAEGSAGSASSAPGVDSHFSVPANRRASEPHFSVPPVPSWQHYPSPNHPHPHSHGYPHARGQPHPHVHGDPSGGFGSAPLAHMGYLQQQQSLAHHHGGPGSAFHSPVGGPGPLFLRPGLGQRPQTSDGIPHPSHTVTLPSAQSIARQIPGPTGPGVFPPGAGGMRASPQDNQMPWRDASTNFPGDRTFAFDPMRGSLPAPGPGPGGLRGPGGYVGGMGVQVELVGKNGEVAVPGLGSVGPVGGVLPTMIPGADGVQYMSLGGPAPKKRPRRRFDEIERLYACGWNGCEKSYGTLNHLNAHVAMQKHGEKRLPTEFKEMRKAWRKKKREATAAAANAQYLPSGWGPRPSLGGSSSSDSDWDRRESTSSMFSLPSDPRSSIGSFGSFSAPGSAGGPPSAGYAPGYAWGAPPGMMPPSSSAGMDSRPSTAGSMSSVGGVSVDGRFLPPGSAPSTSGSISGPSYAYISPTNPSPIGAVAARRPSAPQHLPLPPHNPMDGFRQAEGDHPTPTAGNPFPQSAGGHPHAPAQFHASQGQARTQGQFAFSMLTSPLGGHAVAGNGNGAAAGGAAGGEYDGQFAFQSR